jgi:hypothetical protein
VAELALDLRRASCGLLLEDPYTQEGVDQTVKWWSYQA